MTKEDILQLDRIEEYREGNQLEAKAAQGGLPDTLWDSYSAFAMHRYRDAIYYGNRQDAEGMRYPQNKEVIGGYILFPGRVSEVDKLENKYFLRSIKSVNIGAYPLLPWVWFVLTLGLVRSNPRFCTMRL